MDEVRRCLWVKHDNLRADQAYIGWIRQFSLASDKRYPREMGGPEVVMTWNTHNPGKMLDNATYCRPRRIALD